MCEFAQFWANIFIHSFIHSFIVLYLKDIKEEGEELRGRSFRGLNYLEEDREEEEEEDEFEFDLS